MQKHESELEESSLEAFDKKAAELVDQEESDIGDIDINHVQSLISSLSVSENSSKQKGG